jgi:hypothetical protein
MPRKTREFIELESPTTLTVYTKVPAKYILIDTETGQVYKGSEKGRWDRLSQQDS